MALEKSQIPIMMKDGLDLKADPKQISPGRFVTLENGVFLKSGQIQKCNGYESKAPLNGVWRGTIYSDTGTGCATHKSSLFLTGTNFAWSHNPSVNTNTIVGEYTPITVTRSNAINQDAFEPSCVYNAANKILFYCWSEKDYTDPTAPDRIKYTAIDSVTNSVVLPETLLDYGRFSRVVTSDVLDYYLIIYSQDTTAGPLTLGLYAVAIRKSDYAKSTRVNVDTSTFSAYSFTAYCEGSLDKAYVAWPINVGATDTKIAYFGPTFAGFSVSSPVTTGISSKYGAAIKALGSNIVFGFCDTINTRRVSYNATLTSVTGASQIISTRSNAANNQVNVIFSYDTVDPNNLIAFVTEYSGLTNKMPFIKRVVVTFNTIVLTEQIFMYGCITSGNPIQNTAIVAYNDYYLPVQALQSYTTAGVSNKGIYSSYLVRVPNSSIANASLANGFYYVAAKYYDLNTKEPQAQLDGHKFSVSFVRVGTATYYGLIPETAGNASLCQIGFTHNPVFAELGNNLHVTGGYLGMFDGAEFAEHGFMQQPLAPKLTQVTGAVFSAGTYYYQITYEWQDAYGQIHESAPSDPVSITTTGTCTIDVLCPTLKMTNKGSQVYIAIYRSSDGTTFYRVPQTGINSAVQSQKNTPNILVNDFTAVINDQPILYTSGGEVSNAAAPACLYVASYKRRLIAVPSEDFNTVWYSKEIVPATAGAVGVPVQFANEFLLSVDEKAGPITGVIQLDDKLIIAKSTTISVVTGDGPAANGLQNDFTTPQLVATDTGVEPGRSMVIMPLGVMFKSPKGYYLLDRSLSAQYIGAPVEDLNGLACRSAVLFYARNEVWFNAGTVQIIYNYYFNQWSVATFGMTHSCLYLNTLAGLMGGTIIRETPGIFTRDGVGYSMRLTTGWISFANLQGFQRVYKLMLLGTFKSNHVFTVTVAYDFNEAIGQTSNWTVTSPPQIVGGPTQYRVFMARQKCESIKFSIFDSELAGVFGESYAISNMAFEVGIKRGLNKLPAAQSVG